MKVIVTGGAGFIGSALVRKLIKVGYEVLVVDSLTYASQLNSLNEVADNNLFSLIQSDISDKDSLKKIFRDFCPLHVFNLAAETHVDKSIDSPELFIKTNIYGTYSLLEVSLDYWTNLNIKEKKAFRFLQVSTDEVFGDLAEDEDPFDESNNYNPSSPYSASKASADHLVRSWYRTYKLPVLLSNCSNNYGPFQFHEKLIPLMIIKALRGERLPLYGSGLQIRDWLFVDDHVEALVDIIAHGQIGQSYNIGSCCEKTNLELVEAICNILDEIQDIKPGDFKSFKDLISFVDDRPGHDLRYAINPSKLMNELGWHPKENFESGLRKTIEWYLERSDSVAHNIERIGKGR